MLQAIENAGNHWLTEQEITAMSGIEAHLVERELEALVQDRKVEYQVDSQGIETYRLTAYGVSQLRKAKSQPGRCPKHSRNNPRRHSALPAR